MDDNSQVNKEKAKPSIFYAQKSNESKPKKDQDKRVFSQSRDKRSKPRDSERANSRIETFKPKSKFQSKDNEQSSADSPWKKRVSRVEQKPTFKSRDRVESELPTSRKKYNKEEITIYGENSCQAVFSNRPDSIIKAFITEDKAPLFKALIAHLVENKLGYDVVSHDEVAKIAQTPHHGGICLIVKKRKAISAGEYLLQKEAQDTDYILAIDDINNPHNLGGIARTAAFFNVNAMMLRDPDILENGAAIKIAEGGSESLTMIKSDDFIASIDQFKNKGYEIVALLPCRVSAIKAQSLNKFKLSNTKTLFIIFQQINGKLAEQADKIVYLAGSDKMAALNISVLTGILLNKINSI